jgi:hypothetical protein
MSIKNLFKGDFNRTLDIYCNHLNCGDVDINDNIIKNVNILTSNMINATHLYIRNMNVYDYILSLEQNIEIKRIDDINMLENKINVLQNQINDLKNVIYQLTDINLIT